ncbi:MAG: hypothetical protein AAFP26_00400 [Planctomycetota bacterium]
MPLERTQEPNPRGHRPAALLLALAGCAAACLTGCARVEVAEPGQRWGDTAASGLEGGWQGARSDLVFADERVSRSVWAERPELTRRDALVNLHQPRALTAADEWPVEARPSLDRARYLYLRSDRDGRDVLYFRDTHREGRRGHRNGYRY